MDSWVDLFENVLFQSLNKSDTVIVPRGLKCPLSEFSNRKKTKRKKEKRPLIFSLFFSFYETIEENESSPLI